MESFVTRSDGSLCGKLLPPLPVDRSAAMGGFRDGKVYICGGSSGSFRDSATHNDCFFADVKSPRNGWALIPAMPINTTNAAHAVLNDKMYVFGGFQSPGCGDRPEIQILDLKTQKFHTHCIFSCKRF